MQTSNLVTDEVRKIHFSLVCDCYHTTITFMDSFTNSRQEKLNFQNASSISIPCFGHRTDFSIVQAQTLLTDLVPIFCLIVLVYSFFINFKENRLLILPIPEDTSVI